MKKYKILLLFILGLTLIAYFVLFKIDPSTKPISELLQPEATTKNYNMRPPTVLVTYADGDPIFFKNQHALAASAADKGIDYIYNYSRSQIDLEFYQKNQHILSLSPGRGYWLWKPYFILKTMKSLPEDSIILYADSGVVLTASVEKIVQLIKQNSMLLVGHGTPVPLRKHVKREALNTFSETLTDEQLNNQNIWAFFLGLRNTPKNRALVEKWLKACENQDALTDYPLDSHNQDEAFVHHQHDQSLLSVVIALEPKEHYIIIPRYVLRTQYGVHNFHRHSIRKFESPLFVAAGLPRWLSTILWNNPLMQMLRKINE